MSTINTEAPARAIEWPWGQALELGGFERWDNVRRELTGQMALLCHLHIDETSKNEMLETINFLREVANEHLYS